MQQILPDPYNKYYSLMMFLKALGTYFKWIDVKLKLTDRAYIQVPAAALKKYDWWNSSMSYKKTASLFGI